MLIKIFKKIWIGVLIFFAIGYVYIEYTVKNMVKEIKPSIEYISNAAKNSQK